ncbi:MAG: MarR family transcriptional regulator [Burkholderiaceae bacterium]
MSPPGNRHLAQVAASFQRVHMLAMERVFPALSTLMEGGDLSFTQFAAVMHVFTHGPMRIADIAQAARITDNAASRLVHRLVEVGYVTRVEDPQDRRQKRVELTAAGKALPEGLNKTAADAYRAVLSTLPADVRERLAKAMADVEAHLPAPAGPPQTQTQPKKAKP